MVVRTDSQLVIGLLKPSFRVLQTVTIEENFTKMALVCSLEAIARL